MNMRIEMLVPITLNNFTEMGFTIFTAGGATFRHMFEAACLHTGIDIHGRIRRAEKMKHTA